MNKTFSRLETVRIYACELGVRRFDFRNKMINVVKGEARSTYALA